MLRALRLQVQAALAGVPSARKPALRRSDDPRALLATDLPALTDEAHVRGLIAQLEENGWLAWTEKGWLLMDHPVPAPAADWPAQYRGEWGCCLQLLRRHGGTHAPQDAVRELVKAADMGDNRVERLCGKWHGEFAALLREHKPLPGGLAPYLCAAMKEEIG